MGFIDFTNGEVLTADQMDTVMRQSVMRFADAAARDTALSAVLAEGMMCYLDDTNEVLKYDGSSWIDISGDITGVTAGTALTGGGTSGNVTLNADISALSTAQAGNALNANGELLDVDETAINVTASQITDVTASAAELNILDGVTATTAEVNKLDGLTPTTSELNFVDGVTSGIQSQIDGKQNDVITTQGDLVIGDASGDPVRLPVGSADQVLTSDGTTVSFQDAGGGGLYANLIASGSISGSISITSIPSSFNDLRLVINSGANTSDCFLTLNGSSASDYSADYYGIGIDDFSEGSGLTSIKLMHNFQGKGIYVLDLYQYSSNRYTPMKWIGSNGNEPTLIWGLGSFNQETSINQISVSNLPSGNYELYGVN